MTFILTMLFIMNVMFMGVAIYSYLENNISGFWATMWGLSHLAMAQYFLLQVIDTVTKAG